MRNNVWTRTWWSTGFRSAMTDPAVSTGIVLNMTIFIAYVAPSLYIFPQTFANSLSSSSFKTTWHLAAMSTSHDYYFKLRMWRQYSFFICSLMVRSISYSCLTLSTDLNQVRSSLSESIEWHFIHWPSIRDLFWPNWPIAMVLIGHPVGSYILICGKIIRNMVATSAAPGKLSHIKWSLGNIVRYGPNQLLVNSNTGLHGMTWCLTNPNTLT